MPTAKPTTMKILEGNPGKRPLPEGEPVPDAPTALPLPPSHLSASATIEWYNMGQKLLDIGLLTDLDLSAFALYCQSYGRWVDAESMVVKKGLLVNDFSKNPYLKIAEDAMRDCHKLLAQFGMTPSSRTKVRVANKTEKENRFTGLINGGRCA